MTSTGSSKPTSATSPYRRHRADVSLIMVTLLLTLFGLVVIYAVSPILSHRLTEDVGRNYFLYDQLRNVAIAVAAFIVASKINWRNWRSRLLPLLFIATGLSLLLMFIPGFAITEQGATRWVDLGLFSFQPAELIKLTVVVAASAWFAGLSKEKLKSPKSTLLPALGLLGLISAFVLIHQRDLGTMVVISTIVVAIFFMSNAKLSSLGALIGIGTGFGLANILLFPHRMERLMTFLNPGDSLGDSGYHLHQALIAIGSGGLFGLGLGRSVQVYGYLPEAANDSIFAIIGEMFGFFGTVVVVLLFGILLYRMLKVARSAPDKFSHLLVIGIASWLCIQAVVNIAAMTGLVPLTGIPLPFVSYGGSSLVFMMVALGIVVNVSRYTVREPYADSRHRRRQRRSHNAALGRLQTPKVTR